MTLGSGLAFCGLLAFTAYCIEAWRDEWHSFQLRKELARDRAQRS